jgi:superfamily II DNA or RNA helicase
MKTLRTDQAVAVAALREEVGQGGRRMIMQGPTGFGKTVVIADMTERARAKNKRVLVTVPALSLIDQTVEMLGAQGVRDVGVIQAQHGMTDPSQPVQVASVQTLERRSIPPSDLVVLDEVHRWFKFYEKWLCDPAWQNVPIIGMSATPWTKGLGAYFGKLVIAGTIADMIEAGTLAKFKVYAPSHPDLSNVRVVAGDYHEGDLHQAMSPVSITADVVASWKQHADGRPTICFAVNRAHARQLCDEFEAAGIPSGYMDCDTPLMEREGIRTQLKTGRISVVCNVDVIGLGVDWPEISCISYVRPTRSEMRYVQNIGRGLRAHPGKDHLLILDHSDTTLRLGFVSDIHHDELDDGKPKLTAQKVVALPKECPKCHFLKPPRTAVCPACGTIAQHQAEPIKPKPGELKELTGDDVYKVAPVAKRLEGKAQTYGQLLWYSRSKGYSDGWAAHKYRQIYGVWPRGLDHHIHMHAPDMVLASWMKAQNIRHAKGQEKRRATMSDNAQPSATIPGTLMTQQDLEDFA